MFLDQGPTVPPNGMPPPTRWATQTILATPCHSQRNSTITITTNYHFEHYDCLILHLPLAPSPSCSPFFVHTVSVTILVSLYYKYSPTQPKPKPNPTPQGDEGWTKGERAYSPVSYSLILYMHTSVSVFSVYFPVVLWLFILRP